MGKIKSVAAYDLYKPDFPTEPVSVGERNVILDYMRSFEPSYRTASKVFDPVKGKWTSLELEAFTDGTWGWDTNDIYLFDRYELKLDPGFSSMLRKR